MSKTKNASITHVGHTTSGQFGSDPYSKTKNNPSRNLAKG